LFRTARTIAITVHAGAIKKSPASIVHSVAPLIAHQAMGMIIRRKRSAPPPSGSTANVTIGSRAGRDAEDFRRPPGPLHQQRDQRIENERDGKQRHSGEDRSLAGRVV
jgi:hypothetical protein